MLNLKETLNYYGSLREPIFFCVSYDLSRWDVTTLHTLNDSIQYSINEKKYLYSLNQPKIEYYTYNNYKKQFEKVIDEIKNGNTYLLNLTASSLISTEYSLDDIFAKTHAKYKLKYKNEFVSFSPESFIKISDDIISTYPMKGTVDATQDDAKNKLLNNKKELAEHTMVVDLLRNDLNLVAKNVRVEKFRYVEKIKAGNKELLQMSSQISGDLDSNWHEKLGDIIVNMLPAGSITGTPKKSTVNIIKNVEEHDRGWFSGIWGVYDGKTLESAVMIRFIEKKGEQLIYKSGGGITLDSELDAEYNELKDKIYFP